MRLQRASSIRAWSRRATRWSSRARVPWASSRRRSHGVRRAGHARGHRCGRGAPGARRERWAMAVMSVQDDAARAALAARAQAREIDVVVECAGVEAAVRSGLEWVRPGGRYVQVGLLSGPGVDPVRARGHPRDRHPGHVRQLARVAWMRASELVTQRRGGAGAAGQRGAAAQRLARGDRTPRGTARPQDGARPASAHSPGSGVGRSRPRRLRACGRSRSSAPAPRSCA